MQATFTGIWTYVTMSISYNNNHYIVSASILKLSRHRKIKAGHLFLLTSFFYVILRVKNTLALYKNSKENSFILLLLSFIRCKQNRGKF